MSSRVIWWVRRDLRLGDNTALAEALAHADEVVPVFILDDHLLRSPRLRGPRIAWMLDGLRALDADLREHGSSLVVLRGEPAHVLANLCARAGAHSVFFNRDIGPYATRRDAAVTQALTSAGVAVRSLDDATVHDPGDIISGRGAPYDVYTPFRRAWLELPRAAARAAAPRPNGFVQAGVIESLPIPSPAELGVTPVARPIVPAGERHAAARLDAFLAGPIFTYADRRNRLDLDGTALLSPYLRWGMLGPRRCYWAAVRALEAAPDEPSRRSVSAWIDELIWREFFATILATHPSSVTRNLRPAYDLVAWERQPDWLAAWTESRTGYPVVDAAMRQLRATGWMHNRARMIAASFLCKDLLTDWRLGEAVFMRFLLDGDVASNVGNWQWAAGTGADAAPYFRVFNPTTQGQRFDPEGRYIRRWVPELAHVPPALIHTPERMTAEQQRASGCVLGRDYPLPIVDHATQRRRALAMYAAARRGKPEPAGDHPSR